MRMMWLLTMLLRADDVTVDVVVGFEVVVVYVAFDVDVVVGCCC